MESELINKKTGGEFACAVAIVFFMEFFGTCWLIYAICMVSDPIGIALTLMMVIIACGPVSGAHVNPGVTIAYFIMNLGDCRKMAWLGLYWIAEISGACFGAFLAMASL